MSRASRASLWPTTYRTGMWVWLLHRISGLLILLYGVLHLVVISFSRSAASFDSIMEYFHRPLIFALELLLLAGIIFHSLNGCRILLFDMGIGIRRQKAIFWSLMGIGALIFVFSARVVMPFITGR